MHNAYNLSTRQKQYERVTISVPEFTYFCVQLRKSLKETRPTDRQIWHWLMMQALSQFLGVMGTSIQMDILHTTSQDCAYIRVPARNGPYFWAAIAGYSTVQNGQPIGFRILGVSDYLLGLIHRSRPSIDNISHDTLKH